MNKKRYSNIELLRIISMVMVLSLHSFTWNRAIGSDGYLHDFSWRVFFDYYRESLCVCAVNVYILISGYWGINWKLKSFLNFIFQVYFWSLGVYFVLLVSGKNDFSYNIFFSRLNCLIGDWWFVEAYIGLYLLSPILNAFIEKCNRKALFAWVLLFFFFEIYSEILSSDRNFHRGYNTLSFCGIYILGRLLKQYKDILQKIQRKTISSIFLVSYLFIGLVISSLALYQLIYRGHNYMAIQKSFTFSYNNPLVITQAVCLFLVFSSMNFRNKMVNSVAGSIFAVYLLHMHPNLKEWYYSYCGHLYDKPIIHHVLLLIGLFMGIIIMSVSIDKIRLQIFQWLFTQYELKYKKNGI